MFGLILGIVGLLLTTVGVALTVRAERRAHQSDVTLARVDQQTEALVRQVGAAIATLPIASVGGPIDGQPPQGLLADVSYADVDGDGEVELLVQHLSGPHSVSLKVFGWRLPLSDFGQLADLGSTTPSGFVVGDFDGDGRNEVATIEMAGDAPYALGHRKEVLYRWNDDRFVVVDEHELAPPGEPEIRTRW